MDNKIYNKVIEIKQWEKDDKQIKITDHEDEKFKFWLKKSDGSATQVAQQFKDMGLDTGSKVRLGYVIEVFDWQGKTIQSKKIINLQEAPFSEPKQTQESAPVSPQTPKAEPTYHPEPKVDWARKNRLIGLIGLAKSVIESGVKITDVNVTDLMDLYEKLDTASADAITNEDLPIEVEDVPFS